LLLPALVVLLLTFDPSCLDRSGFVHQPFRFVFLFLEINLTFEIDVLLALTLVELQPLP
jgi:hypothetical protein